MGGDAGDGRTGRPQSEAGGRGSGLHRKELQQTVHYGLAAFELERILLTLHCLQRLGGVKLAT